MGVHACERVYMLACMHICNLTVCTKTID